MLSFFCLFVCLFFPEGRGDDEDDDESEGEEGGEEGKHIFAPRGLRFQFFFIAIEPVTPSCRAVASLFDKLTRFRVRGGS